MRYVMESRYKNVRKVLIKDILADWDEYALDHMVMFENEDPAPIYKIRSWLEFTNPLKKVWVMTYDTDLGRFEEE